jgi:hypothetical protein
MKFAEQIYSASIGKQKEWIKCQLRHFTGGEVMGEVGIQRKYLANMMEEKYQWAGKGHLKMKGIQDPEQRLLRVCGRSNPILTDLLPPLRDSRRPGNNPAHLLSPPLRPR